MRRCSPAVDTTRQRVDASVRTVAPVVLESVLRGSDGEHEDDRDDGHLLREGVHRGHPVEDEDEDEVEVGDAMHLLKQVERQERRHRVLGRLDGVATAAGVGVVGREHRVGHEVVGHDVATDWLVGRQPLTPTLTQPVAHGDGSRRPRRPLDSETTANGRLHRKAVIFMGRSSSPCYSTNHC